MKFSRIFLYLRGEQVFTDMTPRPTWTTSCCSIVVKEINKEYCITKLAFSSVEYKKKGASAARVKGIHVD